MDFSKLIRDAEFMKGCYQVDGSVLMAKKECRIYIPQRFTTQKLAIVANVIRTTAIFAIVSEGHYAVTMEIASMPLTPTSTNIVEVGEEDYYEFVFEKGSIICPNLDLVMEDTLSYYVYDEIQAKGNLPAYLRYSDTGKLFANVKYHSGFSLAPTNSELEIIAAACGRQANDRTKYYRHQIKSIGDEIKTPPVIIPFRNVIYGATNATARLMGSYMTQGMMSTLANPSTKTEGFENLLRA